MRLPSGKLSWQSLLTEKRSMSTYTQHNTHVQVTHITHTQEQIKYTRKHTHTRKHMDTYIYIHTYTYARTHIKTHTHTQQMPHPCTHNVHGDAHINVFSCTSTYIHTCIYILRKRTYAQANIRIHARAHRYTCHPSTPWIRETHIHAAQTYVQKPHLAQTHEHTNTHTRT